MRRRGYTAAAINDFCDRIGVSTSASVVDVALLEHCVREDLNEHAPRVMAVLDPVKVVVDNYREGQVEWLEAENHPQHPEMGNRLIPFSARLYIEREDFMEDPPAKYYRLAPGREVRLKNAYLVTYSSVVEDEAGRVVEIHCTYDPASRGGEAPDGRRSGGQSTGSLPSMPSTPKSGSMTGSSGMRTRRRPLKRAAPRSEVSSTTSIQTR